MNLAFSVHDKNMYYIFEAKKIAINIAFVPNDKSYALILYLWAYMQ